MEFKDNLKQLRTQNNLTQAQLAEKLFVSRSTIAKWENGLGLPSTDSLAALAQFFHVSTQELATKEPEAVLVKKNRILHYSFQFIGWGGLIVLLMTLCILPFSLHNGQYGFTPDMAAGSYADRTFIDIDDYQIYYFTFEGNFNDGRHWSDLQGWKLIKKHFWGCTVANEDAALHVITKNNYVVGQLHSVKGKNGYYHILNKAGHYKVESEGKPMVWDIPPELICATFITIDGVEYELQDGFFFITPEPIRYFKIAGELYDVIG